MTSYSKTITELFDLQKFSIKMGLENITKICNHLNNPENSYPVIHVAGTNGKGSTSRMIQAIISSHGLKVGLYTSPHLVDFRERITVNGEKIDKSFILKYWQTNAPLINQLKATFFDTTTALAFDYFRVKHIDVAIMETGLGGRLDSTNIVKPECVVITPIEIDHTKQLGNNLVSIAQEKSSIIKENSAVFIAKQKKIVRNVLQKAVSKSRASYAFTDSLKVEKISSGMNQITFNLYDKTKSLKIEQLELNLAGFYQAENAALAYLCARWYLEQSGIKFSEKCFRATLENLSWPGRLQLVSKSPVIYFDVSHNYAGFKHTLDFVDEIGTKSNRYLIFGLLDDKAFKPIIRRVQKSFKNVIITEPKHDRALPAQLIKDELIKYGVEAEIYGSIKDSYRKTLQKLTQNDVLFVMGSHYIIGQLLEFSGKNT